MKKQAHTTTRTGLSLRWVPSPPTTAACGWRCAGAHRPPSRAVPPERSGAAAPDEGPHPLGVRALVVQAGVTQASAGAPSDSERSPRPRLPPRRRFRGRRSPRSSRSPSPAGASPSSESVSTSAAGAAAGAESAAGACSSPVSPSGSTAARLSLPRGSISVISTWTFWPTETTSSTLSTACRRRACAPRRCAAGRPCPAAAR